MCIQTRRGTSIKGLHREGEPDALEYTRTVVPLTYWMVVTLAGEEKLVSEMKCGCAAASCTGTASRAEKGVLRGTERFSSVSLSA